MDARIKVLVSQSDNLNDDGSGSGYVGGDGSMDIKLLCGHPMCLIGAIPTLIYQ